MFSGCTVHLQFFMHYSHLRSCDESHMTDLRSCDESHMTEIPWDIVIPYNLAIDWLSLRVPMMRLFVLFFFPIKCLYL